MHKLVICCPNCKSSIVVYINDDFSICEIDYKKNDTHRFKTGRVMFGSYRKKVIKN
jgi:hypothetical protein